MTFCLDTSAWLEYFNAGPHGQAVRKLVEGEEEILTPAVVAAQLVEAARLRAENSKTFLQFLQARSRVVPVDAEVARLAGKINATKADDAGWTMLESLILATARHERAKLLTSDPAFEGLPQVQLLGRVIGDV